MSSERRLVVVRALSNNVVLANELLTSKETILLGKGIGFGAKPGDKLAYDDPRIEKKFSLESEQHLSQYQALLKQIDPEVVTVSEQIISLVTEQLTGDINEHIHLALPSHIEFALYRLRNDIAIENPFLWELKALNPKEYELASQAAQMIGDTFGVDVPVEEIGFLTIHIQSAVTHVSVGNVVQHNHLLRELVDLIEGYLGNEIPKDSVDYLRLVTHLRFAIERIRNGERTRNPFRDKLKDMAPQEYSIARECAEMMSRSLQANVSEDEIAYISMHLYRLFNKEV
ncbi:glucose PTS transporter transcription antiterminator GlcT [Paenibacillus marinisediminis]